MKSRTDNRSPMVDGVCSVPRGSMTTMSLGTSNAASGISFVTTISPVVACAAIYSSATSGPPSTRMVVINGEPGGVWSRIFDTRMVSMPNRLAARKTMSFTGRGAASASIQIFKVGSHRVLYRMSQVRPRNTRHNGLRLSRLQAEKPNDFSTTDSARRAGSERSLDSRFSLLTYDKVIHGIRNGLSSPFQERNH